MEKKLPLKSKPQIEKHYKCYRCGYVSKEKIKYCPKCIEKGIEILMLDLMDK